jgi:hypothetical protein
MLESAIDHLVITASSRDAGIAYVADLLGVAPVIGGEHQAMRTHNALLRLGDTAYLEVIAANPNVPAPSRPRWFELDRVTPAARSVLAAWVVRTNDIHAAIERSPFPLGNIETMTRGPLTWLITIPPEGQLPLGGAMPHLIQWSTAQHPATTLADAGCWLAGVHIRHPECDAIASFVEAIGLEGPVTLARPSGNQSVGLVARVRTPRGTSVLDSAPEH